VRQPIPTESAREPAGILATEKTHALELVGVDDAALGGLLRDHLERTEARLIAAAMQRHHGNKTRVAAELGLTRVGLRMKLARLGLG